MDVRQRVQITRLIEQMDKHPEYAKQLGLEKASTFKKDKTIFVEVKNDEKSSSDWCFCNAGV